jgi:hypothetical protein
MLACMRHSLAALALLSAPHVPETTSAQSRHGSCNERLLNRLGSWAASYATAEAFQDVPGRFQQLLLLMQPTPTSPDCKCTIALHACSILGMRAAKQAQLGMTVEYAGGGPTCNGSIGLERMADNRKAQVEGAQLHKQLTMLKACTSYQASGSVWVCTILGQCSFRAGRVE